MTDSSEDLVASVVAGLEDDIVAGRLLPKERLVEDDLMRRFSAKRHVVRRALEELERLGVVAKERNKTAIIRHFTLAEVRQLYEVRDLLQRTAVERMPLPADPALVVELMGIEAQHAAEVDKGNLRVVYRLNTRFHRALFAACGNPFLADSIDQYNWLTHSIRSHGFASRALMLKACAEHRAMVEGLRTGDRAGLMDACLRHTRPARNFYIEKYCMAEASPDDFGRVAAGETEPAAG